MEEEQVPSDDEVEKTSQLAMTTYRQYFQAGGSSLSLIMLVCSFVICQILYSGSDYWLSLWTNAERRRGNLNEKTFMSNISSSEHSIVQIYTSTGIYIYSIIVGGTVLFSLVRTFHFFFVCLKSSETLHNRMLHVVSRAPLQFFERNPVG